MYRLMIGYAPDWAWDVYRWCTNHHRARVRYPNLLRYMGFHRRLRKAIWS